MVGAPAPHVAPICDTTVSRPTFSKCVCYYIASYLKNVDYYNKYLNKYQTDYVGLYIQSSDRMQNQNIIIVIAVVVVVAIVAACAFVLTNGDGNKDPSDEKDDTPRPVSI